MAGARRWRRAVGCGEAPAHRGELEQVQLLEGVRGVVAAEDEHPLRAEHRARVVRARVWLRPAGEHLQPGLGLGLGSGLGPGARARGQG